MIGDYFTKALQVSQFHRFRNTIIGIHEDDTPAYNAPARALLGEQKKIINRKENPRSLTNLQANRATK